MADLIEDPVNANLARFTVTTPKMLKAYRLYICRTCGCVIVGNTGAHDAWHRERGE